MKTLLSELTALLGANNVLTGEDVSNRAISWFDARPMNSAAIVRPKTTEQISAILKLCNEHQIPLVPMAGMTGFVEGAIASDKQIGLSLELMNKIESIDVNNRSVVVQAGVPLQALHEFAEDHDLHFPVDLGARGSCTIGGMTSTNAGGNEVLRYGMMREQILGLEVVTADGEVMTNLRPLLKNNTGYDLKQLFIGSEGTLGVVTKVALRLRPKHVSHSTALVAVNDFTALTRLLRFLEAKLGGRLSAFEVMWNDHFTFVIDGQSKHKSPLDLDYPYYVLVQASNYDERENEIFVSAMEAALADKLLADAAIASSKAQQDSLWAIRDDIERLTTGLAPYIGYDVSLPIDAMERYINGLNATVKQRWPEAIVITFGHLGDGNLHIFIHIGPELSVENKDAVNQLVYQPLAELDGSVSAEHGIGLQKKAYLKYSRTDAEVEWMRRLKKLFDPNGILNPNVIFDIER